MPTTPVDGGERAARELLALSPTPTVECVRANEHGSATPAQAR